MSCVVSLWHGDHLIQIEIYTYMWLSNFMTWRMFRRTTDCGTLGATKKTHCGCFLHILCKETFKVERACCYWFRTGFKRIQGVTWDPAFVSFFAPSRPVEVGQYASKQVTLLNCAEDIMSLIPCSHVLFTWEEVAQVHQTMQGDCGLDVPLWIFLFRLLLCLHILMIKVWVYLI